MIHDYPYTDFHELNLDWLIDLARRSLGIHLETQGDYLKLVNQAGEDISKLKVTYADTALQDVDGNDIESYILDAGLDGNLVVFTNGNGTYKAITIPYATKANTDTNGNAITSYIRSVAVSGNDLVITDGNNNTVSITVPYATRANKATYDAEGKNIRSYVASIISRGNKLVYSDAEGNESELTVPYATSAGTADSSADGIASITIDGNAIKFTTTGGDVFNITAPYAVKAQTDDQSNIITHAYIAQVVNDSQTGKLTFKAKDGSTIAEITPTVSSAVSDSYGNTIADYVKTIVASAQSNYITITHGNGTVDSLTVNYSTTAYKDTYNNVIGNTYVKRLTCSVDQLTGKNVIIAYNGENSELFRFEVIASSAETDPNGKSITSYIADINPITNGFEAIDGEGQTVETINFPTAVSLSIRNRYNATADGWTGYTSDPNADPYPRVTELVDGNNTVLSQIPIPAVNAVNIDLASAIPGATISAWDEITDYIDFFYDPSDWTKMYGEHNALEYPTVLQINQQNHNLAVDIDSFQSLPSPNQPEDGFRLYFTVHNLSGNVETISGQINAVIALGKSY